MILDGFFNLFKKKETYVAEPLSEKDQATLDKKPYIRVLDTQVDRKNPKNGFFELDWNEFFIEDLKKAGYTGNTDEEIVDKWFKALCQTIASESEIEQEIRVV